MHTNESQIFRIKTMPKPRFHNEVQSYSEVTYWLRQQESCYHISRIAYTGNDCGNWRDKVARTRRGI